MTKWEKAVNRLRSCPNDYKYEELASLLRHFGCTEDSLGKTSGSRVKFRRGNDSVINLHIPHPQRIVKKYALMEVISKSESNGDL